MNYTYTVSKFPLRIKDISRQNFLNKIPAMQNDKRILLIEDNPGDQILISAYLEDSDKTNYRITITEKLSEAILILSETQFDVVLLDLNLPDSRGIVTFSKVIEAAPDIPVILLTGIDDEELAKETIKQGAQNFLVKDELSGHLLKRTIQYSIERKKAEMEIVKLNRLYSMLSGTNQAIVRIHQKDELLREICRVAVEEGNFMFAWIGLINSSPQPMSIFSFGSNAIDKENLTVCEWISEKALNMGKHVFVNSIEEDTSDSAAREEAIKAGCKSAGSVPLTISGKIIGTFNVLSADPTGFGEQEVSLIDEVAKDISFALKYIESETERIKASEENQFVARGLRDILDVYEGSDLKKNEFLDFALLQMLQLSDSSKGFLAGIADEQENLRILSITESPDKIVSRSPEIKWSALPDSAAICTTFKNKSILKVGLNDGIDTGSIAKILNLPKESSVLIVPVVENDVPVAVACLESKPGTYSNFEVMYLQLMTNSIWKIYKRKESEERNIKLSKVVEQNTASIMITDTSGTIEYVNPKFCELTEYSKEELIGQNPRILKSDFHSPEFYRDFYKQIFTQETFTCEMLNKKKSGKLFWESSVVSPLRNDKGEITHFICTKQDISETRINKENLIKLSRAVEQSPVSISISDKSGVMQYVNPKLCEVSGYSAKELVGKNHSIFKSGFTEKRMYQNLWWTILSGKEWRGEFLNKRSNGELYWENMVISPIINESGEVVNFISIGEDITDKKKMIDDLIEAKVKAEQSNLLKDSFIANISHEIRTPLNGILGLTAILKEEYAGYIKPDDNFLFDGIDSASNRIIRTIDMILNYSRLRSNTFILKPKQLNLYTLCENAVHANMPAAQEKNISLTLTCISPQVELYGDEYTIKNAIGNLVENAVKFTKTGSVKVILEQPDKKTIKLQVQDTGIGIEEEYLQYLFEPFRQEEMGYSRSYEGVGLGLALTHEYFKMNNAELSVTSKKGEGSNFTAEFDLRDASKSTSASKRPKVLQV